MEMASSPAWLKRALALAGVFYLAGGVWLVASPGHPPLSQSAGVMVALFGLGCFIAASAPLRHWPIPLLGLLGQVLLTIGSLRTDGVSWAVLGGNFWIVPFALILRGAWRDHIGRQRVASPEIQRMALRARTQYELTLEEISRISPVLLVFLRHYGCMFCREALADLERHRVAIETLGARVALVHMGTEQQAKAFFQRYDLGDLPRVSDPERHLYRAFGLGRGDLWRLAGPSVWWRGFEAAILRGHGFGRIAGDAFQMPGVFLISHGAVLRSYRHHSAADRPDYLRLAALEG
jgi:peroxiredoxin